MQTAAGQNQQPEAVTEAQNNNNNISVMGGSDGEEVIEARGEGKCGERRAKSGQITAASDKVEICVCLRGVIGNKSFASKGIIG